VEGGLKASIASFAKAMDRLGLSDFTAFVSQIESLGTSSLFERSGLLIENRSKIFESLEKIIQVLDKAIYSMRLYVERLDVALDIKTCVFGYTPQHLSYRSDLEEIRSKIGNHPYITITSSDQNERTFPLGVIYAANLHKPILGTVTLRDFCNREETKIPSYLEVISVIDHHKSALQTFSASMVQISDAQSSNVLCAEIAFKINDAYGLGGMSPGQIQTQFKSAEKETSSFSQKRVMQRLLQRMLVLEKGGEHFIDPSREYYEYLHFLYAIFDDTDLLTKMSLKDVECVVHLLNRMKSISLQKEVEVLSLDHIPRDRSFVRSACRLLLQHPDTYSMYSKMYRKKEELIEKHCKLAAKNLPSILFDDTKEQNGCARVGQTKLYNRNIPTFKKCYEHVLKAWYGNALQFWKDRSEVDLHLHMISTLLGADELYKGEDPSYRHQDEMWIWIPFTEQSIEHLKGFLNAFSKSSQLAAEQTAVELHGMRAKEYQAIFSENFPSASQKIYADKNSPAIAVLKYRAGLLNSRKAMVSPYLPRSTG
ncbi:MAG: hypothetical protein HYZ48_01810, partial [Chlamydiales bacterium]|nr:hypothetical protein [Chlamydiales bacterium]